MTVLVTLSPLQKLPRRLATRLALPRNATVSARCPLATVLGRLPCVGFAREGKVGS